MAATTRSPVSETRALREIILKYLSKRFGKTKSELFEDVENDFGTCGERRLHRQLAYLTDAGCIRRDREWDLELGWWRPIYFLRDHRIPGVQRSFCDLCGLVGTRTSSHPLHLRLKRHLRGEAPAYVTPSRLDRRKCINCKKANDRTDGSLVCTQCSSESAIRDKERRSEAIAIGLCGDCRKRKASPGRAACDSCLDKHRDYALLASRVAGRTPTRKCSICIKLGLPYTGHDHRTHDRYMKRLKKIGALATSAARPPSAGSPGSRPSAATSDPRPRPR